MPDLITQFQRRIERYFEENGIKPKISIPGTNHIDNPNDWSSSEIYKGESVINLYNGILYTSDGNDIIVLNSENAILEGMQVAQPAGAFGGGIPRWLTVTNGSIRINGRTYKHISSTTIPPVSDGDIQVAENASAIAGRYDLIYAQGDYPNKYDVDDENYKLTIGIVNGTSNIEDMLLDAYNIPDESILLAIVWVPPSYNDASTHMLRPWSWGVQPGSDTGDFQETYKQNMFGAQTYPLNITSASELIYLLTMYQFEHVDSSEIRLQRVYLRNQIIIDNVNIYKVVNTHYCENTTASLLSGDIIGIGGGGVIGSPGSGGGVTIHALLTGLAYDSAGHTGFQRSTLTVARDPLAGDSSYPPAGFETAETGVLWINTLTQEIFISIDDTPNAAIWVTAFGDVKDTTEDKNSTAIVTIGDNVLAMNHLITETPANNSYVKVEVNGLNSIVGDGVDTNCDCYFSEDSGVTPKLIDDIIATDELYWMGTNAGFDLAITDEISLFYLVNTAGDSPSSELTGPLWGGDAVQP